MRNSKLFNSIGYEIYEDLLDKNDCNTLIEAAYEMKGSQSDDYSPIMHPHRQKNGEIFSKTIKKKKIFNILRSRIGKDVMLLQSEFFFMPPGTEGFAPHQDDFYVKSEDKDAFISLWFPLIDVNQNNGCLRIWEKTHKLGILDVIVRENTNVKNVDKNGTRLEAQIPKGFDKKDIPMKLGSGLLIHSRVVHSSNNNISNKSRYSILYTFIRKGIGFNSGKYSKRVATNFC